MQRAGAIAVSVLVVFGLAACGDNLDAPGELVCDDGIDNDGDGATDCADTDCSGIGSCPVAETDCDDTLDNDGDGSIDCADSDCAADPACLSGPETDCDDTVDNDSDGATDCADSDCAAAPNCVPETACMDTMDNDGDGATDCADTDCAAAANCVPEAMCMDGLDDDSDGLTDCLDPDCAAAANCVPEALCMDGLDDDSDGDIDCADSDCAAAVNCNPEANCADTIDNDLDGMADCMDTDCAAACTAGCPAGTVGIQVNGTGLPSPFGQAPTMTQSPIAVAATGTVALVAVRVDVTHPYVEDAELTLESPGGVTTLLTSLHGSSGDNYTDTLFIDSAFSPIGAGMPPFTGSFRPDEALVGQIGGATGGTWILHAEDVYPPADNGTLDSVELFLCVCNGPECEIGLACRDGVDSDGDTLIDCADPNCAGEPNCIPEPDCDDGIDNDLDMLTDCLDMDCDNVGICEFGNETTCNDDLDNDADGVIDCADAQCAAQPLCSAETNCADTMDNDMDGLTDCLDPGCDGVGACELDTEVTCGDMFDNDGDGQTDCADSDCSATLACVVTCPAGTTKTAYTATDVPVPVIDLMTRFSRITVPGNGLIANAAVRINITHTWDEDMDISLIGPGDVIVLSSDNGGSGDNYTNTVFVDTAAGTIGTAGFNTAPFTGQYRPEQPFATFFGMPADGDWDLSVFDDVASDQGTINSYELLLCACEFSSGACEFGEACRDGLDNDGNTMTDCAEPACATDPFCIPEADCNDGLDNDLDGEIDCLDNQCNGIDGCEFGMELSCTDSFDNDADGLLDCLDSDCPTCPAICGNNDVELSEACDDGDLMNGDGCSSTCAVEPGFSCSGDPSVCVPSEIEPNEDGTPQTGGNFFLGNDFDSAGGVAVMNANNNGALDAAAGNTILVAQITPAGDEDVFAITNTTASPQAVRFDLWNRAPLFGVGVACGTSIDTVLNIRDAAGTVLAQNDDRNGALDRCSALTYGLAPGQTVYAQVIEFNDDAAIVPGYLFQLQFSPVVCGDSVVVAPVEECEDGNSVDTDACTNTCLVPQQEMEPNGTVSDAAASSVQVSSSTAIRGSIGAIADLDLYQVSITTETVLRIESFVGTVGDCLPSTTLVVRLHDSLGAPIIADTVGSGVGLCGALVFTVAPGVYFVQIEESGNNAVVPRYFVEISYTAAAGAEGEPPMVAGLNDTTLTAEPVLASSLDAWAFGDHMLLVDEDVWAITVPPGRRIRAEIIEGDRAVETCEALGINSRLTLYDSAGVQLVDDDDDGRGPCSKIDGTGTSPVDLAARNSTATPQTMYLRVRRSGVITGQTGEFIYRLQVTLR